MNVTPFKLRSASEINSFNEKIISAWNKIQKAWEIPVNSNELTLEIYEAYKRNTLLTSDIESSWNIAYSENKDEWLAIKISENIFSFFSDLFFKHNESSFNQQKTKSTLLNYSVKQFMQEFTEAIFKNARDNDAIIHHADSWEQEPILKKGCGILKADLSIRNITLNILISDELISKSRGATENKKTDFTPYIEALSKQDVPLSVFLGDIKMNIKQFHNLEEGDIIKLDKNIREPIDVLNKNKKVLSGFLCQKDNKKTIKLISN
jgi:flagellar motor switch/type III secretory pathway protein FliN